MSDLSEILRSKLIPWTRQNSSARFIVAKPIMLQSRMPERVQLIPSKIVEKRVITKDRRYYRNTRSIVARWPQSGLNEVSKLKLACVLSGHADYQLGDFRVRCGAGNFIFIPPGTPHPDGTKPYVDKEKSTSCDLLFFQLHPNAIESWISHWDERGRTQIGHCLLLHESASLTFRALVKEVIDGSEKSYLSGEALLSAFLVIAQREVDAGHVQEIRGDIAEYFDDGNAPQNDFSERLKHYVLTNLNKPLTLDSAAREMFMSRAQFTRVVRRETGQSFNEILAFYRMEEAKSLLQNSDWSALIIAKYVGFSSPSYFHTFFKKFTGKTPSAYRLMHRKG